MTSIEATLSRLRELLLDLSLSEKNSGEIEESLQAFLALEISYSQNLIPELLPIINSISSDKDSRKRFSILISNMKKLKNCVYEFKQTEATPEDPQSLKYIKCSIFRPFFDACLTEATKFQMYNESILSLKATLDSMEERVSTTNNQLADTQAALKKAKRTVSSLQTQLVTVLSVFSAIVITFSTGFNFIGNAIAAINNTPLPKAVFIVLTAGLVLFNTVFLLLYMVGKITEKPIYANCKTPDCSCAKKCGIYKRTRNKFPIVFYTNLTIAILLLLNILWYVLRFILQLSING